MMTSAATHHRPWSELQVGQLLAGLNYLEEKKCEVIAVPVVFCR